MPPRARRSQKAGLRSFAFVAFLGAPGGILGESTMLVMLALVEVLWCCSTCTPCVRAR